MFLDMHENFKAPLTEKILDVTFMNFTLKKMSIKFNNPVNVM